MALKGGLLDAEIMLNLDSEDDSEITIGCAGGIDVTVTGTFDSVPVEAGCKAYDIAVKGLTGGHSGMDIHLGRGNANKLLNRILLEADNYCGIGIAAIHSGGLRNAIPREGFATVVVPASRAAEFEAFVKDMEQVLKAEYATTDPNLVVLLDATDVPLQVIEPDYQAALLRAVAVCPSGIHRMSPDIDNLVQTSNNLASVTAKDGEYRMLCLTRGSVDSEKMELAHEIRSLFELIGADVDLSGAYPGWAPKPDAPIVKLMGSLYEELFGEKAPVLACHAGLECGILGTNYPDMQMISFGPNIRGAHSPDEKVQISSVQKFWGYLMETLKRIPEKK
ncbi:MAG: M20/M25/M40 family metallo-hydrolase, partial [Lysobacterales bacterium]|jgi:dipeptidase D